MSKYQSCAYPLLKEASKQCDYEVASDEIASMLGYATHIVKHIPELERLVLMTYHLNGSIRGKLAVTDEDRNFLESLYVQYEEKVGRKTQFVLPQGSEGACFLHMLRSKAKAVVRLAYAIEREEHPVPELVLDLWNMLSNVLFQMALYENLMEGVQETVFVSKSYGN